MAFSTPYEDVRGTQFQTTYCRATVGYVNKNETSITVTIYGSSAFAPSETSGGKEPIAVLSVRLPTDMGLSTSNPIEYAYLLLQDSGVFPEAVWGI